MINEEVTKALLLLLEKQKALQKTTRTPDQQIFDGGIKILVGTVGGHPDAVREDDPDIHVAATFFAGVASRLLGAK